MDITDEYIMTSRFTKSQSSLDNTLKLKSVKDLAKASVDKAYVEQTDIKGLKRLVSTIDDNNYKRNLL